MVDQPPRQDRRPWPPNERDRDRDDGDDVPERPPTEPQPPPVEEPPAQPGQRGPYVVEPSISTGDQASRDSANATDRNEQNRPTEPLTGAEEAAEGLATEIGNLAPGAAPSEPGTFGKDPSPSRR